MPSFLTKTFSTFFNRILQINQSGNSGVDATTRAVQSGDGANTSISLSDDVLQVQPQNDDTAATFRVNNQAGSTILSVETSNKVVKSGESQVNTLTLFKEMGLHGFAPTAGVHNPLMSNNMMFSSSGLVKDDSMFGNDTDPATTLDLNVDGTEITAVACYWYLDNDITLDSVRYIATASGSDTLNFHIMAYTLDVSTNHGDLSGGILHANASVAATSSTVKTGTFSLDNANIDASKVVIGFVESDSTTNLTVSFQINYHIR